MLSYLNLMILKDKLKQSIYRPSATLIIVYYIIDLFLEFGFNLEFIGFISVLLIFDIFFYTKIQNSSIGFIYSSLIFIFFYSVLFFSDTLYVIHELRFRSFLFIFSSLTLFMFYIIHKYKYFLQFNIFLLFFALSSVFGNFLSPSNQFNRDILLNQIGFEYQEKFTNVTQSNKPIIFIILDELSSTSEIYDLKKDSLLYKFDNDMKNIGFKIYDPIISKSKKTSLSLTSLFNLNLHNNSKYLDSIEANDKNFRNYDHLNYLLSDNILIDSLSLKDVESFSYGVLPFKSETDKDFFYMWEKKDFERPIPASYQFNIQSKIFTKSLLNFIIKKYFFRGYDDTFRFAVYDKLSSIKPIDKQFYYFHFYSPHEPYSWGDEYYFDNETISSEQEDLNQYIQYSYFFEKKSF